MKTWQKGLIVLGVLAAVSYMAQLAGWITPSSRKSANFEPSTIEHKLAIINKKGDYLPENHSDVEAFKLILNRLDRECPESRQQIADMIVKAHEVYQNDTGRVAELLWVAQQLNESVPDENNKVIKFAEISATWLTLVEQ